VTDGAIIQTGNRGLVLRTHEDMQRWADGVLASGMAPESLSTSAKILVATQYGLELGLTPMVALNSIVVLRGRPTIYGDTALAMVKKSGLLKSYLEKVTGEGDGMVAEVISERIDSNGFENKVGTTFTVADARQAGLWGKKGTWTTHPKRMLKYKARAFNLRDNFPDILTGMHIYEEMLGEELGGEQLAAPTCATPKRADRKQVDSSPVVPPETTEPDHLDHPEPEPSAEPAADVADEKTVEMMEAACRNEFTDKVTEINDQLFLDIARMNNLWDKFTSFVLMLSKAPETYTVDMLRTISKALEAPLDPAITEMIPKQETEHDRETERT